MDFSFECKTQNSIRGQALDSILEINLFNQCFVSKQARERKEIKIQQEIKFDMSFLLRVRKKLKFYDESVRLVHHTSQNNSLGLYDLMKMKWKGG